MKEKSSGFRVPGSVVKGKKKVKLLPGWTEPQYEHFVYARQRIVEICREERQKRLAREKQCGSN